MNFQYKGIDKQGKNVIGTISALKESQAIKSLRDSGVYILEIEYVKNKNFKKKLLGSKYVYQISKELSVMLNAGLNIEKSITLLIESLDNQKIKILFENILNDIKSGSSLSSAFENKGVFDDMVISLIKVGESTGNLKEAFENIAEYTSFKIKFKSEVINALIYPAFLSGASLVTIIGIFKFIIPKFFSLFAGDVNKLPFLSKLIFKISLFLDLKYILTISFMLILLIMLLRFFRLDFKNKVMYILIDIPFIGSLIKDYELSKFYYSMYVTLKGGLEFLNAFELSRALLSNRKLYDGFRDVSNSIKTGNTISKAFSTVSFLQNVVIGMLKVGEESGNLKDIFHELYIMSDERLRNRIKKLLVLIEPVIITLMGLIIGTIVISLILTVMGVSNIKL